MVIESSREAEAGAGREERVVNFKDREKEKKSMKMPTGQECFQDCKISLIQLDLAYQQGKIRLEQWKKDLESREI